jgi:hypothetical protein
MVPKICSCFFQPLSPEPSIDAKHHYCFQRRSRSTLFWRKIARLSSRQLRGHPKLHTARVRCKTTKFRRSAMQYYLIVAFFHEVILDHFVALVSGWFWKHVVNNQDSCRDMSHQPRSNTKVPENSNVVPEKLPHGGTLRRTNTLVTEDNAPYGRALAWCMNHCLLELLCKCNMKLQNWIKAPRQHRRAVQWVCLCWKPHVLH